MTTRGIEMSMVETSVDSKLIEFSKSDAAIALMAEKFLPLTLANPTDAKGFGVIHEARMLVKTKRVEIEKRRVELKADALAFGRQVDSEAKRLTAAEQAERLAKERIAATAERERLETIAKQHAEVMQPDSVKILKLADAVEALAAIQLSVAVSAKHKTKLASILRRSASEIRDVANSVKVVGNE